MHVDNLVSPFVDDWHINVIDKHRHSFAGRWPVRRTHPFVHITLNCTLQHTCTLHWLTFAAPEHCHYCRKS